MHASQQLIHVRYTSNQLKNFYVMLKTSVKKVLKLWSTWNLSQTQYKHHDVQTHMLVYVPQKLKVLIKTKE